MKQRPAGTSDVDEISPEDTDSTGAQGRTEGDEGAAVDFLSGAALALVAGAALFACASQSALALLIAVAATQGCTVLSWVIGTALPGRIGALVIGAMAAAAADTVVSVWPHGQLGTLVGVVGLALAVMFFHQLTRGVVRARVVESLSDIALLIVVTVALASFVQLRHEVDGRQLVMSVALITGAALVVGFVIDLVCPRPRFDPEVSRGLLAVVVSTLAGAAVGYVRLKGTIEFNAGRAAFLGAALAAIAALFAMATGFIQHASSLPSSGFARRLRPVFGIGIAYGLVAPTAYLLCLAIRG
ncbi:MAG: hypothetical protein JO147_07945 [Actinobacteria bacterium]|nr:hypothetical protein [Actinomycetota bacterium]